MTFRGSQSRGVTGEQLAEELAPKANIQRIILGEDAEAIQLLNTTADTIGKRLAGSVTTSQIRNVFGAVRSIEQDTTTLHDESTLPLPVQRALTMLRPKLAYQYGRTGGREDDPKKAAMGALTTILSYAIGVVLEKAHSSHFRNFVDFFEAILAYHRFYGGKNS